MLHTCSSITPLFSCHSHQDPGTGNLRCQNSRFNRVQGRDSLSTNGLAASSRLLWCVMLTLLEKYCKSFFRMYQDCLKYRKKRKRELRRYPLKPPPAANFTPIVNVCQLVLCYKNITIFYSAISAEKEACRREPTCRPVRRFGGTQEKMPRPAAAANLKPLCGKCRTQKSAGHRT